MSVTSPNRLWMSPPPTYDGHTTSHMSTTSLKPYLQLPHLLSLTWLAYPILSLVFVAFRLQLSLSSSEDAVANAKNDLLTSCKAAEGAATAAASMPRYMAIATNQQFAEAVNGSMNAARAALVLSLTVMEGIINFIIDIYRSTFLCFMELVIRGGLAILISAVQEFSTFLQSATSSIRTSIQNDITSANSVINGAIASINKVNPFGAITAPQITVPSLSALENITLPATFQDALTQLNSTLPTFADLKDKVEAVIDTPFELLKQDINDTFANMSFDASILPVPETNLLSFCNDLDTSIVDDLGRDLVKIAKIGTIIIILLALLLIALNCLLEWYKWRCMKRHLEYTRQAWISDPTMYHSHPVAGAAPKVTLSDHNLLMLQANGSHPLLTRISNTLSARLRLSPSQHTHLQWFFHYIFHPPALACFLIGFFGLLSVQIQLFAMRPLVAKYSDRAASSVSDFSNTIATSINNSMYNQSATYANDVNGRVDAVQSTINQGVFGWVNGTTVTLNNTIVEFYNDVQTAVSTVFNGTILEQPAQEFIKCILGTKVDAIENGLTFMHDNLKVDIPRMNQTILILSPASVDEATKPIAVAALGDGSGDDQGLIGRLVNTYAESLKKERLMFGIFMGLWGFVVLMGLAVVLWHSYGKRLVEGRKRRRWEREQRAGINGIVVPYKVGMQAGDEKVGGASRTDLPSFTPMPSPKAGGFNPFFLNHAAPSAESDDASHSRSLESLKKPQSEKSWDSFFGKKSRGKLTPGAISKPMKLMAIGQKAMGKERFVSDNEPSHEESSSSEQSQQGNRSTAWFGRIAGMLGRKQPESTGSTSDQGSFRERTRPNLRISIDRASSVRPEFPRLDNDHASDNSRDQNGLNSRWSASPDPTRHLTPWMNHITPTKSLHQQNRPPGLPFHPKPRHNASVPSDVDSVYADSMIVPVKPAPLALPLHHGFDRSGPGARTPPTPPPMNSPTYYLHPRALAPPPRKHRRSSSVPDWKMPNDNDKSITPVTRLLTTMHARQSSNVNPFVTPFDDEHRVTIDHASHASDVRRSIPTNPFDAIAL